MKKAIKKIVARQEETKYHSEQILSNNPLDWAIHTPIDYQASPPQTVGDVLPLVPRIAEGDGSFQRSGVKIHPTRCRVDVSVSIAETPYGIGALSQQNTYTNDIFVVMYILRPKMFRNYQCLVNGKYNAFGNLLDNGDGTYKSFGRQVVASGTEGSPVVWCSNKQDLQLPVNTEQFTLIRRKIVRLTKNYGTSNQDGSPSDIPNLGKGSWSGSFTYKLPTLTYDDFSQNVQYDGGYPTNSCLVMAIGAVLANNCDSLAYTQGQVIGALDNPITVTARTHCWYKDA